MNASEFRIGNLVDSEYDGFIEVNVELLKKIQHNIECVRGILITEEWLLKLGFKFDETKSISEISYIEPYNVKVYIINNIWFCTHFDLICGKKNIESKRGWCVGRRRKSVLFNKEENTWEYSIYSEIKYVHQLQNLYFLISKSELEIAK